MSTITKENGGPAFPSSGNAMAKAQAECVGFSYTSPQGMTLRDYFAAKAMQANLTALSAMETWHGWSHDQIAEEAYKMADAMIKARQA